MNDVISVLQQILAEQKKTNQIIEGLIAEQKTAMLKGEDQKKQMMETFKKLNPQVANMMQGIFNPHGNGQ